MSKTTKVLKGVVVTDQPSIEKHVVKKTKFIIEGLTALQLRFTTKYLPNDVLSRALIKSSCIASITIDLFHDPKLSADHWKNLASGLIGSPSLTHIAFMHIKQLDMDASAVLCRILKESKRIRSVNFSYTGFSLYFGQIYQSIITMATLEELSLEACDMEATQTTTSGFKDRGTKFHSLKFSQTKPNVDAEGFICDIIENNDIINLDVVINYKRQLDRLQEIIKNHKTIKTVNSERMLEAFIYNTSIIDLKTKSFSPATHEITKNLLLTNTTLRNLDLMIGSPDKAIVTGIETNRTLKSLKLAYSNITNDCYGDLAKVLAHHTSLKSLSLFTESFEEPRSVANIFWYNTTLTALEINHLFYDDLYEPLKHCTNLQKLTIALPADPSGIFNALKTHPKISHLVILPTSRIALPSAYLLQQIEPVLLVNKVLTRIERTDGWPIEPAIITALERNRENKKKYIENTTLYLRMMVLRPDVYMAALPIEIWVIILRYITHPGYSIDFGDEFIKLAAAKLN